ncbi:MAG: DUF1553 domain-containing protein [Phycisphaerales bacterium]|nr:DUF1553 domain-containing protein [Phycisphaerales bacterium]
MRPLGTIWLTVIAASASGLMLGAGDEPLTEPATAIQPPSPGRKIDYQHDVRPILAKACYECHAGRTRRGGLRLDSRADAMKGGKSGTGIVPANPDGSLLLRRVLGLDDEDQMPLEQDPLPPEEIETLRLWIEQGAVWPDAHAGEGASAHWSYVAPVEPPLPAVGNQDWCRNGIDRFVLARLDQEHLAPSAEADRARLIRRVSLDLIGLPPSIDEVDAFIADQSPDAYAKVVERLLASPRYGERWAQPWLDLARYADTNGYEKDLPRSLWPWRDWVIQALNDDMPFDEFTIEQLAGDLLPDATRSQQIATGFHRNTMLNDEGGIDPEEFRVVAVVDRVNTTATVWLGTTMACSQCHDHKYDPISQREYYGFLAFFNQTEDVGVGNGPYIQVPTPQQESQLGALRLQIAELQKATINGDRDEGQEVWETLTRAMLEQANLEDRPRHHYTFDGDTGEAVTDSGREPHNGKISADPDQRRVPGISGDSVKLDGGARVDCEGAAGFELTDAFSYGAWVRLAGSGAIVARIDDTAAFRGFDLFNNNGKLEAHFIHEWPHDGLKIETHESVELDRWRHVMVTYDGTGTAAGVAIFVDGVPQKLDIAYDTLKNTIRTEVPLKIGSRHGSGMVNGQIDDVRIYDRLLSADQVRLLTLNHLLPVLAQAPGERTDADRLAVRTAYVRATPALDAKFGQIDVLEKEIGSLPIPTTMVMKERLEKRPDHIMVRGDFRTKGETVEPLTPKALHAFPDDLPRNRLGLANWLTSPKNPLIARVAVNRAWEAFFGDGLVLTVEDFGSQGDLPTHPELLDWLASQYIERGWSTKALHRLIVTSATYRQSSKVSAALLDRDPYNRLFARGPRVRMEAEMVRDNALAIGGLLSAKIGGPSVFPPQPMGIWVDSFANFDTPNEKWVDATGEDRYRRGIYTYWRRSASYPSSLTFDAARRDVCVVKRSRSNTPLQALATLNDPVHAEAAIGLAKRMMREARGPDAALRAAHGFRLCVARQPSADEISDLMRLFDRTLVRFQASPNGIDKLIHQGGLDVAGLDTAELAAWVVIANVMLNLDETINR